ncbi:DUF4823 domain-containing protein [Luteibacter sp. CQ10]|uniref:DUF4823 domain-containing protein n=1 Tax=Luteibacter sp. CQ10 TaxID=2805821 RepID=UPI0034A4789B
MKKIALAAVACIVVSGCSVPRSVKEGGPLAGQAVSSQKKVLVLSVTDGQEKGQDPAIGSGQAVVASVRKYLTMHGIPMSVSSSANTDQGIVEADAQGFDYVLKPTIILWEDNATAWSGNGDKLSISMELFDARTHQLVAASTHKRVATGATFVGGSPDRFIDEVSNGALGKIYGWSEAK